MYKPRLHVCKIFCLSLTLLGTSPHWPKRISKELSLVSKCAEWLLMEKACYFYNIGTETIQGMTHRWWTRLDLMLPTLSIPWSDAPVQRALGYKAQRTVRLFPLDCFPLTDPRGNRRARKKQTIQGYKEGWEQNLGLLTPIWDLWPRTLGVFLSQGIKETHSTGSQNTTRCFWP